MTRTQIVGLALLVGGTAFGSIGWLLAPDEVTGLGLAFVGLMALLCGGMLLHAVSR
jgi:hypothetical protein